MRLGIIGNGAIAGYVCNKALENGHVIAAVLLRPERLEGRIEAPRGALLVDKAKDLPNDLDHVVDCAGHAALRSHGPDILRSGLDLTTVSLGALADADLFKCLENAATAGGAKLHLASGAIGALDCLRAARIGKLLSVTYTGRKPPQGWKGSLAE